MNENNCFKFIKKTDPPKWSDNLPEEVVVKVHQEAGLEEMCRQFTDFLKACGFPLSPEDYVDICNEVDDEIEGHADDIYDNQEIIDKLNEWAENASDDVQYINQADNKCTYEWAEAARDFEQDENQNSSLPDLEYPIKGVS